MKQLSLGGRAGGATAILLAMIVVLAGGLWFARQVANTAVLEAEAKNTFLESLKMRWQLPVRVKSDAGAEQNEFLEGANYTLAANGFQQRIVGLIESSGGSLVTVGIDPPDDNQASPGRRVVVQVAAELTNDGLQQFMYRLESERPFVLVDSLSVRQVPNRGAGDGAAKDRSLRLAVDLRAYGYFRGAAR